MAEPDSFEKVVEGLRANDESAAGEVFGRYANRLIGLARGRLDRHLRQKLDPEDVVQSVFRSFFTRQAEGQFDLETWDGLWSLLVRITLRKCAEKGRAFHAARRDVGHEVNLGGSSDDSSGPQHAIARDPTPQEAASLVETLERLLRGLDETQQPIVVLRLQGYTVVEISKQLDWSERTVKRVLGKVRGWLMRMEQESMA